MKSLVQNQNGSILAFELIILALVLGAAGYAGYQYELNKDKVNQPATSVPHPTPTAILSATPKPSVTPLPTTAPSDTQLISAAERSYLQEQGQTPVHGTNLVLGKLEGNYAEVGVNPPQGYVGGFATYLKKSSGTWTVVYSGQQAPNLSSLGFPSDFDNGTFGSTVIYTY